ncbi:MAG: hypothetical protein ACYDGY_03080 [Acidimicrobiales bacterium]
MILLEYGSDRAIIRRAARYGQSGSVGNGLAVIASFRPPENMKIEAASLQECQCAVS